MLGAFAERADATGAAHTEIEGRWPDAADGTPAADVVVCHNVVYNVADLVPFVRALADHECWVRPSRVERTEADVVSFIRRRLCVGPDADPEIRAVLHDVPLPRTRTAVTLWWSPTPAERTGNMDAHAG